MYGGHWGVIVTGSSSVETSHIFYHPHVLLWLSLLYTSGLGVFFLALGFAVDTYVRLGSLKVHFLILGLQSKLLTSPAAFTKGPL